VRAVHAIIAIGPSLAAIAIASCSTEGDALYRVTRDSGVDSASDTVVAEARPETGRPDTRLITCGNDAACVIAGGEQCCAYLLSYYCAETGQCDGALVECDQPAHCATGQRCCGASGGFLIQTQCTSGTCTQYEMCATNDDCTPPKICKKAAGNYGVCEP
jgi:hypothetical protein